MKTLYISDLDGTLLNSKAELQPETLRILNTLIERGLHFTYATARAWTSASKVTKGLKLHLPVVTYNGAFMANPGDGGIIRAFTIKKQRFEFLLSVIGELNLYPLVYTLIDGAERVMWIKGHETKEISTYLESRRGDRRLMGVDSLQDLNQGQIYSIVLIGAKDELAPIASALKNDTDFSNVYSKDVYSDDYWFEIYDARASKAAGVKWLRENYGFKKVICFGDNLNDIPMFQAADEGYAVQNACDELKLIADGIIGSNEENSVARFIESVTGGI